MWNARLLSCLHARHIKVYQNLVSPIFSSRLINKVYEPPVFFAVWSHQRLSIDKKEPNLDGLFSIMPYFSRLFRPSQIQLFLFLEAASALQMPL
jgi:hypothetical protein